MSLLPQTLLEMAKADILTETRLLAWRREAGLTLEEVSGLTGISVAMLSKVERGKTRMAPLTRVLVARRLGAPLRALFDVEPIVIDEEVLRDALSVEAAAGR